MDVSPQLLREVEFREQWRGYSPDEVDEFLERLAVAVEGLQAQLRETMRRLDVAERRSGEREDSGDELRRTLVLAQRTADAAVEEAHRQASDVLGDAQERAENMIEEAHLHVEEVLGALVEHRAMLEEDVEGLNVYVAQYRKRLQRELREGLSWLERSGRLEAGPPPELSDLSALPLPKAGQQVVAIDVDDEGEVRPTSPPVAAEEQVLRFDDTTAYDMSNQGLPEQDQLSQDLLGQGPATYDRDMHDTGPHEILLDGSGGVSEPYEAGSAGETDGQDPFLAELRRAVTEAEPLGPRDQETRDDGSDFLNGDLYDEGFSSRFRRRRS